jgi:hypothetical protein
VAVAVVAERYIRVPGEGLHFFDGGQTKERRVGEQLQLRAGVLGGDVGGLIEKLVDVADVLLVDAFVLVQIPTKARPVDGFFGAEVVDEIKLREARGARI